MKRRPTVIRKAFWGDVEEASLWYETKRPGLGIEFEDAVVAAIRTVAEKPEAYPHWVGPIRRTMIDRFAYAIVFSVVDNRLFILGVVHGMRDLPRWLDRRLDDE